MLRKTWPPVVYVIEITAVLGYQTDGGKTHNGRNLVSLFSGPDLLLDLTVRQQDSRGVRAINDAHPAAFSLGVY